MYIYYNLEVHVHMFNITDTEKELLRASCTDYFRDEQGRALFKLLTNYLISTTELKDKLIDIDNDVFGDEEKLKKYALIMINHMLEVTEK